MTDALSVALALDGKPMLDGYLCHCPVPDHGQGNGDRNPSLLIKDGNSRLLFKCFAGCDAPSILDVLRRKGLLEELANEPREAKPRPTPRPTIHEPDAAALEIWRSAKLDACVRSYLRNRGITLEPPASLRQGKISHLGRYEMSAMVAAVQRPDGKVVAVQQTILTPNGRKAAVSTPRITTGALGEGALRLGPAGAVLGLAEGTETALSAMQLTGVPCWASLGGMRMHRVVIPTGVTEIHLFGDNDEPGKAAIERAAAQHKTRRVVLRFPLERFKDWNDVAAARIGGAAA